ncbi:MAG: MFS transporter [Acetobacter sp.]|uniref:MFS transporter n=1 Tax=Acetobacter sp. TaxID=440 RepID=UPI0039EBEB1C
MTLSPASALAQRSTRLAFLIAGLAGASWAPIIPYVQLRCGLTDTQLGLLLLCPGIGSVLAMPLSGALAGRLGCRWIIALAGVLVCCCLPVVASSHAIGVLAVTLALFGAGVGAIDCTINIQAVMVERASGRIMMSGFHGLFSVGGLLGATGISILLGMGFSPTCAAWVGVGAILLIGVRTLPGLLASPASATGQSSALVLPRGPVLLIGLMCCVVFLAEGAATDWSAVFLATVRHMSVRYSGMGYVAFACTMTAGRLLGNRLTERLGERVLVVGGSLLAAAGMLLAVFTPFWQATLTGYVLLGAGCANIVPVLYSAVGRQRIMPEHMAVSAITVLGYSGILAGPAAVGFVAGAAGLPAALAGIGLLLGFVALMAFLFRKTLLKGGA